VLWKAAERLLDADDTDGSSNPAGITEEDGELSAGEWAMQQLTDGPGA
jgi:hypothetical protein